MAGRGVLLPVTGPTLTQTLSSELKPDQLGEAVAHPDRWFFIVGSLHLLQFTRWHPAPRLSDDRLYLYPSKRLRSKRDAQTKWCVSHFTVALIVVKNTTKAAIHTFLQMRCHTDIFYFLSFLKRASEGVMHLRLVRGRVL